MSKEYLSLDDLDRMLAKAKNLKPIRFDNITPEEAAAFIEMGAAVERWANEHHIYQALPES